MERSSIIGRLLRTQKSGIDNIRSIAELHLDSLTRIYRQGCEIQRILLQLLQFLVHFLHC